MLKNVRETEGYLNPKFMDTPITKRILAYDYETMQNRFSKSYVHRRLSGEICECLGSYAEEYAGSYVRNILEVNEACIQELNDLEEYDSLSVLGYNMTYNNINNTIFALIGITATAYEIFGIGSKS